MPSPSAAEDTLEELAAFLITQCKKCAYVELRATPQADSMLTNWELSAAAVEGIVEEAAKIADSSATNAVGGRVTLHLFTFKAEGEARHNAIFKLTWGSVGKKTADVEDASFRALVGEVRGMLRETHDALLKATGTVVDQTKVITDASTKQLAEASKQLGEYQKDAWKQFEMMRIIAEDKRGEKREDHEAAISRERTRVGGELLSLLAPAALAKFAPGAVASSKPAGDFAVLAFFRTFSDAQRTELTNTGVLALSSEQVIAATSLFKEIKGAESNGGIESHLLASVAKWGALLKDEQVMALATSGRVGLSEVQAALFLEIYVMAAEHDAERQGKDARPS